jgi:hypothetical protein
MKKERPHFCEIFRCGTIMVKLGGSLFEKFISLLPRKFSTLLNIPIFVWIRSKHFLYFFFLGDSIRIKSQESVQFFVAHLILMSDSATPTLRVKLYPHLFFQNTRSTSPERSKLNPKTPKPQNPTWKSLRGGWPNPPEKLRALRQKEKSTLSRTVE